MNHRVITLYFVRHGQALHNIAADMFGDYAYFDPIYRDAELTEKGIAQAKGLQLFFKRNPPDLIYSSSLRRCLQTLDNSLVNINNINNMNMNMNMNSTHDIIVDDRLIERCGQHPCNKRSDKQELHNFINKPINIENVNEIIPWSNKRETNEEIIHRGRDWYYNMLNLVRDNININRIVIYTHYEFLDTMLNNSALPFSSKENGIPFSNCEVREIKIDL
jgi:broad specificity phosphatase PhoE